VNIRSEKRLEFQLIEIMLRWEGRLISKHLMDAFGVLRQQASRDINDYKKLCPTNLEYDKKRRVMYRVPPLKKSLSKAQQRNTYSC